MAIPGGLIRITFQSTLGGSEIALWGFHVRLGTADAIGGSALAEVAEKTRDTWLDAMQNEKLGFSSAVVLQTVRADHLDPAPGPGHLKVLDSAFADFASSGAGSWAGTNASSLPWECSMVVSMAAYAPGAFAVNKGRRRGRYYLPPAAPTVVAGPTGEFTEQTLTNLIAAIGDFHETLNDEVSDTLPDQLRLVVLSRADDTVYDVEHLWIDSKVDAQRRRENRQPARERRIFALEP